jgi:uncharacterized membrane protein YphA (DoxX/SURF4 family)/uncharacterized membrane protein
MNSFTKAERLTILDPLAKNGRLIFALAMMLFGIQHLAFVISAGKMGLGGEWTPSPPVAAFFTGALLFIAGICIAANRYARLAAILLAILFIIRVLAAPVPGLIANIHSPGDWIRGFEFLAICGACLTLSASSKILSFPSLDKIIDQLGKIGPYLFAISLPVFCVQHFLYGPFVATLIPSWIPFRLFWAYFVGAAFCTASLAILTRKSARLAATLLGLMFFLWFLILHSPRVFASPHKPNEWSSAFVALAMAASSWIIANAERTRS